MRRYRKPRFSTIAPAELKQKIGAECRVAVEALGEELRVLAEGAFPAIVAALTAAKT